MDLGFSQQEKDFRKEVREYLSRIFPKELRWTFGIMVTPSADGHHGEEWEMVRKIRRQIGQEKGWFSLAWPEEYGGKNSLYLQNIFFEEALYQNCPAVDAKGVAFFAPTIIKFGTEEQKQATLPAIARGESHWCELLSEPDAGSDLASLKTVATPDGDYWRINGQKVWSTGAHLADKAFILVRTDPTLPRNKGLSYFILDMDTPGITVSPIINMYGEHEFNEVFLDDVKVHKDNMVGGLNKGWYVTMATLDYERFSHMVYPALKGILDNVVDYLREHGKKFDQTQRMRLAQLYSEIEMSKMIHYRAMWIIAQGKPSTYEVAIDKMYNCELGQRVADFVSQVFGHYGALRKGSKYAPLNGWPAYHYLDTASYTIMGGSSEIDRNVIALRGLGLPLT